MINLEKNLYISNNFDFFNKNTIILDKDKYNIFFTDTNISAQLKNNKFISEIYHSDIFKLSFKFEEIKSSINEESYQEIIKTINEYILNSNDNNFKSIIDWKNYLFNILSNEIASKSLKRKRKYIKYPLEIFLLIQNKFIIQQKLYIKEKITDKDFDYNELLLADILEKHNDIRFLQTNFGSNLESYISQSGIKGEVSTHKIHSYNHFTLSFINNSILDCLFEKNKIFSINTSDTYFHLLFRYFEGTMQLLFEKINNEINEINNNFSSIKNFSFKKYKNEVVAFLEQKKYNIITLIIIEYMLNYNLITQKYSEKIPKQLEGFGSNGITHNIKYQNTILDLILLFTSLCFVKKTNWKSFFITNDQGYLLLKELYNISIPIPKNKVYIVEGEAINSNYPNHQINIEHKIIDNNYIKIIDSKKHILITKDIKNIVVSFFEQKSFIL
jgi:hypothetical protein